MITLPNGKICMNEQEAIQWLLNNNPIPFQCSANYAAGTEIGLGTIVNPSPAKVRVGSLIFFADSKVSTVIAITSNSFICSDEYNDLVDDVVYVSNVEIDASGHLIVTLSNDEQIDAGLIKQVSGFSIDASQHLIASYNDGSTTDLGAIFQGNVNISGTLNATRLTGDEIVENMSGYSASLAASDSDYTFENVYTSAVKNGNKLTLVSAFKITQLKPSGALDMVVVRFNIPSAVGAKLYPTLILNNNCLSYDGTNAQPTDQYSGTVSCDAIWLKYGNTQVGVNLYKYSGLTQNQEYYVRLEKTFLLANNLIS